MRLMRALALAATAQAYAQQGSFEEPYRAEQFDCAGIADGPYFIGGDRFGYGRFRMRADLNFDGREDLIVNDHEAGPCGTGGCAAVILLQQADGHFARQKLWLHPAASELARKRAGLGLLQSYWHISAREGSVTMTEIGADVIRRVQADSARAGNAHVHGSTSNDTGKSLHWSPLKPEYAWCKGSALEWRDNPR